MPFTARQPQAPAIKMRGTEYDPDKWRDAAIKTPAQAVGSPATLPWALSRVDLTGGGHPTPGIPRNGTHARIDFPIGRPRAPCVGDRVTRSEDASLRAMYGPRKPCPENCLCCVRLPLLAYQI